MERFASTTEEEINKLVEKAVPESTKKSTSFALKVFDDWRTQKSINTLLHDFSKDELVDILRRFYVEARTADGKNYSRNSMKVIRAGLDRHLSNQNSNFSITFNKEFKPANDALNAHLVDLARRGMISSTKHKISIAPEDIEILYEKEQLGLSTPESLVQTAWFNVMLYFGKRGRENQRDMVKDDIKFHKSSSGLEYATLIERATKNHQGGINSNENEVLAVMAEIPGNPRCPLMALKKYLSKRNEQCQALWQKPRDHTAGKFSPSDEVWFCNAPLGKHTLNNLITQMSKKAGLSTIYTPHCIRATSVTILKASGLENARVKSITGHKSDSAIESYHSRPTLAQQVQSSAIVSQFVAGSSAEMGLPLAPVAENNASLAVEANLHDPVFGSSTFSSTHVRSVENSTSNQPQFSSGHFTNCVFNFNYGSSA